jgi:hypothetical protein
MWKEAVVAYFKVAYRFASTFSFNQKLEGQKYSIMRTNWTECDSEIDLPFVMWNLLWSNMNVFQVVEKRDRQKVKVKFSLCF